MPRSLNRFYIKFIRPHRSRAVHYQICSQGYGMLPAFSGGSHTGASLGFIFILSFACFFVASLGVSASIIGIGCLVVTMISVFSPAAPIPGLVRSAYLMGGGLISFLINFYVWPFDPEKVLLSAAKLAVEDMGFFFDLLYNLLNYFAFRCMLSLGVDGPVSSWLLCRRGSEG